MKKSATAQHMTHWCSFRSRALREVYIQNHQREWGFAQCIKRARAQQLKNTRLTTHTHNNNTANEIHMCIHTRIYIHM